MQADKPHVCRARWSVSASVALLIGAAAVPACDADATGVDPAVTGMFHHAFLNGVGVPFVIQQDSLCATIYDGGFLELRGDGRFVLVRDRVVRSPCAGSPRETTNTGAFGAFGVTGDSITFRPDQGEGFVAELRGDSVLLSLPISDSRVVGESPALYVYVR